MDKASLNEEKIETIINIIGGVTAILMYVNLRIYVLFYWNYERMINTRDISIILAPIPVTQQNNWSDVLSTFLNKL